MSSTDIVKLIRECGRAGVSSLSYQGLEVRFSSEKQTELPKTTFTPQSAEVQPMQITKEQQELMTEVREYQLAIDDPMAFEQMQIDQDLEVGMRDEGIKDRGTQQNVHGGRGG